MRSGVTIAPAQAHDTEAIAALLNELDRFYGAIELESQEQRLHQIQTALFSSPPAASALLAWNGGQLVGLASYSFLWPAAGSTRSLYLKELYVTEEHRGNGVGRLLMDRLCELAAEHGCSRVEWTADEDNPGALKFYEALGCQPARGKIFYRMKIGCD